LINSKKEYNIKLIAVVAIVSIILVSSVAAGGAYYLLSDDSSTEQEETYGMYENIPSESDFVMQVDSIGLVEDQITRDIANELHE
jgi:flagellar basal body-associated protein FliL